jgi:hypothetical protein
MVSIVISALHPGCQQAGVARWKIVVIRTGEQRYIFLCRADSKGKNFFVKELLRFFWPPVGSLAPDAMGGGGASRTASDTLAG